MRSTSPRSDDLALAVALDYYLIVFEQSLEAAALGSVVVRLPDEAWTLGSGPAVATLTGRRFDRRCQLPSTRRVVVGR